MRALLLAGIASLTACGQAEVRSDTPPAAIDAGAPPADASAGSTGVGAIDPALAAVKLDAASVTGSWSFDGTCASGDAMGLMPDGKVYFDEWGEGAWSVNPEGLLVLDLRELTPGVEDAGPGEQLLMMFTASEVQPDLLVGKFSSPRADIPARDVVAKRCP
jgi:hypothetical protein